MDIKLSHPLIADMVETSFKSLFLRDKQGVGCIFNTYHNSGPTKEMEQNA